MELRDRSGFLGVEDFALGLIEGLSAGGPDELVVFLVFSLPESAS